MKTIRPGLWMDWMVSCVCVLFIAGIVTPAFAQDTDPGGADALREMMAEPTLDQVPEADPDAWLEDPFGHLSAHMTTVAEELSNRITDDPVPDQQDQIVSDLDQLIELLEKACSAGSGAGTANASPTRPAQDSTLAAGPGGQGELIAPKDSRHEWADLPPNERKAILQSDTENYPPGYRETIEDYFNSLAVERPVREDNTADEDTE